MISILSVSYISQKLRVILSFCVVTILKDLFLSIFMKHYIFYLYPLLTMNLKPHEEKYWGIHCIENYGKRHYQTVSKTRRGRRGSYWNARLWSVDVQLPTCFNRCLCLSKIKNVLVGMNLWIISLRISSLRDL